MNEVFDFNKKIDQKEYRKDLANKLRETINESGFEEARNQLEQERGGIAEKHPDYSLERPKSLYEKSKALQLAQWIIEKSSLEPGDYNDEEIKKQIKKFNFRLGGDVDAIIFQDYKDKNIEAIPNLEKITGDHSDIILQPGKDNKFISIDIVKPEFNLEEFCLNIFKVYGDESAYKKFYRKSFLEGGEEKLMMMLMERYELEQKEISKIFIARPYEEVPQFLARGGKRGPVFQHEEIRSSFLQKRDMERVQLVDYPDEMGLRAPLILRKNEISIFHDFIMEIVKIIEEEEDPIEAQKKIEKIPVPVFKEGVSDIKGGYVELKENGAIRLYGSSEKFGPANKEEIVKILKKDFPNKEFQID